MMKRVAKENEYIFESYESGIEFVNTVRGRPNRDGWPSTTAREKAGNKWSNGNLKTNQQRFIDGDPKLFKLLKGLNVPKPKRTADTIRPQYFNSPVGYSPNVPNAIMGLPNSMISSRTEPKKTKVIDVLYDAGFSANVKPKQIAEFGNRVLNYIQKLEKLGYRVRLSIFITFSEEYSDKFYACKIQLKNERQPLNLKRVAYPLISSGMLRMLFFDWLETCPESEYIVNYGIPLYKKTKGFQKRVLELVRENSKQVYLYYGCDIIDEFNLEEDSI